MLVFYLGRGLVPRSRALNKVHFHFQLPDLALSEQRGGLSPLGMALANYLEGKKRYLCQFAGRARGSETLPNRGAVIFQAILIEFFKNSIESTKISVQDLFITPTNIQGDPSRR